MHGNDHLKETLLCHVFEVKVLQFVDRDLNDVLWSEGDHFLFPGFVEHYFCTNTRHFDLELHDFGVILNLFLGQVDHCKVDPRIDSFGQIKPDLFTFLV